MYTHTHTHTCTHTHTRAHTYTHAHTHTCTRTHTYTITHTCTCTHTYTNTHACTHTHTYTNTHTDAHRALELLEEYRKHLQGSENQKLNDALTKAIVAIRSRLFQALLGEHTVSCPIRGIATGDTVVVLYRAMLLATRANVVLQAHVCACDLQLSSDQQQCLLGAARVMYVVVNWVVYLDNYAMWKFQYWVGSSQPVVAVSCMAVAS